MSQTKKRTIALSCIVLFIAIAALVSWRFVHIRELRSEMESHIAGVVAHVSHDRYDFALNDALEALALAERLRDSDAEGEIEKTIRFIEAVLRAKVLFGAGSYLAARDAYQMAHDLAARLNNLDLHHVALRYTTNMAAITEGYIRVLTMIERAGDLLEQAEFEAALSLYEDADRLAAMLFFADGRALAEAGIKDTTERINQAKREQAGVAESLGDLNYMNRHYTESIAFYQYAIEIFTELDDSFEVFSLGAKIELAERGLERQKVEQEAADAEKDDTQDQKQDEALENGLDEPLDEASEDPVMPENGDMSNFDHNSSIFFDMVSLIDDQRLRPANQIRMGSIDGRNEGWYNGCGWVAAYNALILLDAPRHPSEIVRHFESGGGTVMEGLFGTYPRAIEGLFIDSGYNVSHVLFPQSSIDLDAAIKASNVSILAYLHTRAAHYVAIEYSEADDKFIVYNDGYARARSVSLGYDNNSAAGAVIDSPAALIRQTPNILFSFSLITITVTPVP